MRRTSTVSLIQEKKLSQQERIALLQEEIRLYSDLEQIGPPTSRERLLKILSDSIDDTAKRWMNIMLTEANTIDEKKLMKSLCTIASKYQTLKAFEYKLKDAAQQRQALEMELNKLKQED